MNVHDVGAYLNAGFGGAASATAAGAGDNTEINGPWIDRRGYLSIKVLIGYTATLAATETLSLASNIQDATDSSGTGAADYGTANESLANAAVATGGTGGSTEVGVASYDVDLVTANGWIRVQHTPDLSAAGTDTAIVSAVAVLGGKDVNPA